MQLYLLAIKIHVLSYLHLSFNKHLCHVKGLSTHSIRVYLCKFLQLALVQIEEFGLDLAEAEHSQHGLQHGIGGL